MVRETILIEKLGNRTANFSILPADIAEALRTDGLRKLDHIIEKLAGLIDDAARHDCTNNAALGNDAGKCLEFTYKVPFTPL